MNLIQNVFHGICIYKLYHALSGLFVFIVYIFPIIWIVLKMKTI